MHNKDVVGVIPVNTHMSSLNGIAIVDMSESAHPVQKPSEGQRIQQRILVVEDDPALASLEAEVLTAHGYIVVTVHSGERALVILHHFLPDLVVLDLELTGSIGGWEVLQALRASAPTPVLITTSSTTAVRKYIRSHGETRLTLDHLPKPYQMPTLLRRIQRMLMILPQ
jgi:DNA-binding response OmpR family regulator